MAAFSEEEFLRLGFEAQGDFSWSISKRENQIKNFRSLYGTSPKILSIIWAEIWTALQSTGNAASAIPLYMLILYRWMKSNQSENELKSCFGGISVRTIRKWRRILVVQVANLRTTKIDSNWNNTNGLLRGRTVDGIHYPIDEPRPFSTSYSSHKLGRKAGFDYEFVVSTDRDCLCWLNGPFPAGKNDKTWSFSQSWASS